MDKNIKVAALYVGPMITLSMAGLYLGIPGAIAGLAVGYLIGKKLEGNKAYRRRVGERQKFADTIYGYFTVGLAGFIFFSYIGAAIGVVALLIWNFVKHKLVAKKRGKRK